MDFIRNELVFSNDYFPLELVHREREISEIAHTMKLLAGKKGGENIFITGPPGTGKSTSVRGVIAQLENSSTIILPVHVNCCLCRTNSAILKALADKMEVPVIRNLCIGEMLKALVLRIKVMGKQPLIVLDDVDLVEDRDIIHEFLRCHEQYGVRVALVSIANNKYFPYGLEHRMQSMFAQKTVVYEPYNTPQLKDILRERAKVGLFPGSYDEDVLGLCAAIAGKRGDARLAISLLHRSAAIAEQEGAACITVAQVRKAQEASLPAASKLNEVQKRIVETIGENEIDARELYDALPEIAERTMREKIEELVAMKILKVERIRKGQGKSRKFSIDGAVLEKYK